MGCGCQKKKLNGQLVGTTSAGRRAVYQVVVDGQTLSEYSTPMEARKAAAAAGGRVRVTSQPTPTVVS